MIEENVWNSVLSAIEKRINHESFTTWFRPITFLGREGVTLRLAAPDRVFEDWILDNYRDVVEESLEEANLSGYSVNFEVIADAIMADEINSAGFKLTSRRETPAKLEFSSPSVHQTSVVQSTMRVAHMADAETFNLPLNQKYIFETFVVGSCNQFAHAAALAVADSPSKTYNPLYIYGGVGLGKTHLMCAIGHRLKEQNRHLRLRYTSAENFMNEMINAIRYKQAVTFREKYRSIDVLLIDDIQFLAGKEGTQDEFFHTFYELYERQQKQIVISSDCPPKDIPILQERLHSRFAWGLIADIQSPDFETKVAILRKKAETEKINLPKDVAEFIATKIKSNIRELEGALIRLNAISSLRGVPTSLSLAKEALKDIVDEETQSVIIEKIISAVAKHYRLKVSDLKSISRKRDIVLPRQVAMYICDILTEASSVEIGEEFGGKDHSTVLHSIDKIRDLCKQNSSFHNLINSLIDSCK